MALLSSPVSSLINGVSQQPASLRFPSQVEAQDNAYSSISSGLTKRHPSQHVAGPLTGVNNVTGTFSHLINRDSSERYCVLAYPSGGDAVIKVFDLLTGTAQEMRDPTGQLVDSNTHRVFPNPNTADYFRIDSNASLQTGVPFAFSFWHYLPPSGEGGSGVNAILGKYAASNANSEYIIERNGKGLLLRMNGVGELYKSVDDVWEEYDTWAHVVIDHDGSSVNVYANGVKLLTDHAITNTAASGEFCIGRRCGTSLYAVGGIQFVGFWKAASGYPLGDAKVTSLYNSGVGLGYDGLTADLKTDLVSYWNLDESTGNAIDKHGDNTLTEEGTVGSGTGFPALADPFAYIDTADMAANLRAVTVVDHTWLVDSTVATAMDSVSLTPTRKNEALVVIWKYKHGHTYKIKVEDKTFQYRTRRSSVSAGSDDEKQENREAAQSQGWLAEQLFIELGGISDVTTVDLTTTMHPAANVGGAAATDVWGTGGQVGGTDINNNGEGLDGDGASNSGAGGYDGWVVKQTGPVIHIYREDEADFDISVSDDSGDEALTVIKGQVQILADLPTKAPNGMQIKIVGDEESGVADEYYVEFSVNEANEEDDAYQAERQSGATATDTEAMADGVWQETTASGVPNKFDSSTMPHKLVRLADGSFIFRETEWTDMPVGDADTNPQPSFIGEKIKDIFFFKNRIGFLADDNVIMSATGEYNTFWRTKIVQLLDSDPIDVGIAHTSVAKPNHAIPFQSSLILFTDTSQFILAGDETLSPKTTTIEYSTEFENSPLVRPVTTGRSIFFAEKKAAFSGVREWYQVIKDEMHDALDITAHCPTYIPGNIVTLAGSTHDNILIVRADGDPDAIYVYKYMVGKDEKLQSSWSRYVLEGATILDIGWIDTSLYLILQRTNFNTGHVNIFIEKMIIEPGLTDTDSAGNSIGFVCNLDRRVTEADCSLANADGVTTITLPCTRGKEDYQVMFRKEFISPTAIVHPPGSQLTITNPDATGNTITVNDPYKSGGRSFDESQDQYFTVGTSDTTTTGNVDFWISTWFKLDAGVTGYPTLLSKGSDSSGKNNEYFIFWHQTDKDICFDIGNGSSSTRVQTSSEPSKDEWHFLFCWVDRVAGTMNLRIDDEATVSAAATEYQVNANPFRIGVAGDDTGPWDGDLAKVGFGKPPSTWTPDTLHDLLWADGKGRNFPSISDADKVTYGLTADRGAWFPLREGAGDALDSVNDMTMDKSANGPGSVVGPDLASENFTGAEFFIGTKYAMEVELSRPYLKPQPNSPIYATGRYQLMYGHLIFHETDYLRVEVQPSQGRTKRSTVLNGGHLGATKIVGQRGTSSGQLKFPIYGRNDQATITVINDTPFPSAIMGLEYEASFNPRATRIG